MSEYSFTWRIKNYSSCCKTKGEALESPKFYAENLEKSLWSLCFYPKGDLEGGENNFVSAFLVWHGSESDEIYVELSIELVNGQDYIFFYHEYDNRLFCGTASDWGTSYFMDIDELIKEMNSWSEDSLTIRCRIKCVELSGKTFSRSEACSTIGVDRSVADMDINIPSSFKYSERTIFSFSNMYKFEINVETEALSETVSISFQLEKHYQSGLPRRITFNVSLFDTIGCKLDSKRSIHLFNSAEKWEFPTFITKKLLEACKTDSSQYQFKMKCEAYISNGSISHESVEHLKITHVEPIKLIPNVASTSELQMELQRILITKKYSDVTIRTVNEEFPAHKFVLRIRSPVFAAMFDQDMLENQTGVVDVTDLNGQTLKFLYTENVDEMDYETTRKLILAADKYQVPSLVGKCASFLKSAVSVENVCEIVVIADLIHCESLKLCALNYIKVNAAKILPTSSWSQWIEGNVKLATYILSKLSVIISNDSRLN